MDLNTIILLVGALSNVLVYTITVALFIGKLSNRQQTLLDKIEKTDIVLEQLMERINRMEVSMETRLASAALNMEYLTKILDGILDRVNNGEIIKRTLKK